MNFDVKTEKLSDGQYVISLAGEVDLYTAPEFKQQLLEVIDQAIATRASEAINTAYTKATTAFQSAEQTYQKLVLLAPKDPNIQLELAQAAQQSGDTVTAIAAYQAFLKLAPDDPSAGIVKQQIAQLKAAQASPSSG